MATTSSTKPIAVNAGEIRRELEREEVADFVKLQKEMAEKKEKDKLNKDQMKKEKADKKLEICTIRSY